MPTPRISFLTVSAMIEDQWRPILGLQEVAIQMQRRCLPANHQLAESWEIVNCGTASLKIICKGLLHDNEALIYVYRMVFTPDPRRLAFSSINGEVLTGDFLCTEMDLTGKFHGEESWCFTFQSSGKITVMPADELATRAS